MKIVNWYQSVDFAAGAEAMKFHVYYLIRTMYKLSDQIAIPLYTRQKNYIFSDKKRTHFTGASAFCAIRTSFASHDDVV